MYGDASNKEEFISPKQAKDFFDLINVGVYPKFDFKATINKIPEIKQVIFNPPATIIIWKDGTKTIVKTHNEEFSEEHGFAMAYLKKVFGGRNQYMKYIKNASRQEKKEVKEEI
jgi:hypothetical protein